MSKQLIAFHLIFLGLLFSCNGSGPSQSKAKIEISRSQLSVGVNDVAILYLIDKDRNEQTAVILDESNYSAELNFGNWEFAVILWEGSEKINSELKCGRVSKKFSTESDSISIKVSRENCDDSFFSPSSFRYNGEPKTLELGECGDLSTSPCSPTGGIQSFKVRFQSHPKTSTSLLSEIEKDEFVTSDCLLIGGSSLSLPFGGEDFNPPLEIEAYSDDSCTNSFGNYFFPNGVANFESQTDDFKIVSDSTNISIFFKSEAPAVGNLVGCLENEVITGFSGRSGAWIDKLGVSCQIYQNGYLSGSSQTRDVLGGVNGDPFSEDCPPGSAVASLTYWDNSPVTGKIQFICKSITDYSVTFPSSTFGNSGDSPSTLTCPNGEFLRSLDYSEWDNGYGSKYIALIGPSYICR
jgi:hypothetical protein